MLDNYFVSVRIKTLNTQQTIGQIKHDTRETNISYIRNNNNNIFLDNNFNQINDNQFNHIEQHYLNSVDLQKRKYFETYKQKSQLKNNSIAGVITFSNQMSEDYENNKELFLKNTKDNIEKITQQLGVELIYASIHLDEKVPHIHFLTTNYDQDTGKGKSKELFQNKEKLTLLQDLSGKVWEKYESGYIRGKKREITQNHHYSVLEGHKKEIDEIMQTHKTEIENLKQLRNEVKQIDIDINEKKEIYTQITQQQNKLRESAKTYKTTFKKLKSTIVIDTNEIIKKIPIIGNGGEKLKKLIKQKLYKSHKKEIEDIKRKNEYIKQLEKENQQLKDKTSLNNEKHLKLEEEKENQCKTITDLKNTLKNQNNNIILLEKRFQFNYVKELEKMKNEQEVKQLKEYQLQKEIKDFNNEVNKRINTPYNGSLGR